MCRWGDSFAAMCGEALSKKESNVTDDELNAEIERVLKEPLPELDPLIAELDAELEKHFQPPDAE